MKTSMLRDAVATALVTTLTSIVVPVMATELQSPADPKEQADQAPTAQQPEDAAGHVTQLESMTVTGTRIRGSATPSPVITIDSGTIREEGFTDLGEVIRSIPQNFSGGQNPGVAVGATTGPAGFANQNITGGSSLNLRGLGPDATLTLLNGRRLAYGGFVQAVDISAIPVSAVDRLEIVPDGASAIYGSDAVGGVGNVILKRDYQGITAEARYGAATSGGLATREYSLTGGVAWSGGGLIAAVKSVSADPIYARDRNFTEHMFDPTTLYPGSDLRSGLVSLNHDFGNVVTVQLDVLRTRREQDLYQWNTGLQPWYNRVTPTTDTMLVSPGIQVYLARDWTLSANVSYGSDDHVQHQSRISIDTGVPSTIIQDCYCNEAATYEVNGEGPIFSLPAGDVRLALGVGERTNKYIQHNYLTSLDTIRGKDKSRFAYAEVNLPLVAPVNDTPGVHRLDLSAALRGEDYESFGSVTTPKVGLVYGPSPGVTFTASWGRSFKAPTLYERYQAGTALLHLASFHGGTEYPPGATVLGIYGGNPDLRAERARTSTVSVALHPVEISNWDAKLTWFDIDYRDRVVQPITDHGQALGNPDYAAFVDYSPTLEAQRAMLAAASAFFNVAGGPYVEEDVVALIHGQYANVARQRVRGADLATSAWFDTNFGRIGVRGQVSWLESSQQNTDAEERHQLAGTVYSPPEFSGRGGVVWSKGRWNASAFVNHTAGLTNVVTGGKTASMTTVDATIRYVTAQGSAQAGDLEFALSVHNLLDRDPPLHTVASPDRPPYDSTNFPAVGRFLSFSVAKHW